MPRTDTGKFLDFQNPSIPGVSSIKELGDTIKSSIDDIYGVLQEDGITRVGGGADFTGSVLDEVQSLFFTTLDDKKFRPNGDHFGGRNMESELTAIRETYIAIRDDESRDTALRTAMIPEIVKIEQRIADRKSVV